MKPRGWLAALALTAFAGCVELAPDVGQRLAGTCDDADSDPKTAVSFSTQVRPLIVRPMAGCGCHLPSSSGPGLGTQVSGLDLGSLAAIRAGGRNSGTRNVIAMEPCASILYQKIDDAPPFGSRMPLGGPPFLTEAEVHLVHDWIAEGAADN
jgi:hypothetical protein